MLNKNPIQQIRTCQRIKLDQGLYILTMFQKKLINKLQIQDNKIIDTEKYYQENIIKSWNHIWKIDLTKPVFNNYHNPYPNIFVKNYYDQNQMEQEDQGIYREYNQKVLQFVRRMRVQHEDQSNFKITEIDINEQQESYKKYGSLSKKACKHYITAIENMCNSMKTSIQKNSTNIQLEGEQQQKYCSQIRTRINEILQILKSTQKNCFNHQLFMFISSCINVFDNMKQTEQGSTVLTIQPKIDQFTYILHPLLIPIYAYLLKQKDQIKPRAQNKQHKQTREQQKQVDDTKFPFKQYFTSNIAIQSKIIFINLDGYQSQFNLQFARCFKKNLLYISFLSFYNTNIHSLYQKRLYKKIMYNWQKNKMRYNNTNITDEFTNIDYLYFITNNIQNYFNSIQNQLYKNQYDDLNKNMFIFPFSLQILFNNFVHNFQQQHDICQQYISHAVIQIFKSFLINQIKQFMPNFVILSWSGKLIIQDKHFIQIIQQLIKLTNYKLLFFPNLTTRFCSNTTSSIKHDFSIQNIDFLQRKYNKYGQINEQVCKFEINYEYFNKISRFLKISSGTYNLTKNYQQQDILNKYKNFCLIQSVTKLMEILANQYNNIQRNIVKYNQVQLIPKIYEKDYQKIIKSIQKLVPFFYIQLYSLLQSIISVCIVPKQKKAYIQLSKYNIDPDIIKDNYIITDLIYYIKNKISRINEMDNNYNQYERIKKYLDKQKDRHFSQICHEKYQDSILMYFKMTTNWSLYNSVQEGKSMLAGLIDVSFANPNKDIKDCMFIFQSTRIMYKIDQCKQTGNIPIIITNYLPYDKKSISKYNNYCAFLKRQTLEKIYPLKNVESGKQKIYEQKKIKPYLIKLFDQDNREIIQNRFQFRTQWNYCQTSNYMILYWPTLFNFIEALSNRFQGKVYQPTILNEFFIGKKQITNDAVCFYRANVPDDIAPRTGCSAYEFKNLLYIFGGFYDRSKNYLSLQRDITLINLGMYTHQTDRKLPISNIKNELYEAIKPNCQSQKKINSYIRARRQYQLYDIEDISQNYEKQVGIKQVIMVGGFGENFIHPFSLLTCYYYRLRFQDQTGKLISIKKQFLYNRTIPVNISGTSKNMGVIRTPIREKHPLTGSTITQKLQLTQPQSSARFRIVYKIQKNTLNYKYQYIFTQKNCKLYKQQYRKIQYDKYQVNQSNNISIQKIQGINHMVIVEQFGNKSIIQLKLQIYQINQQKQMVYKLTHDSISYINIINGSYLCAVIKHPIFTNDHSLLAQCKIQNISDDHSDQTPYITLKPLHSQLKGDLTLHIIQASNINLIYVLHGHRLYNSNQIYEYQITNNRKSGLKIVSQIKPKKIVPYLHGKSIPKCCYSTFFYNKTDTKNQIICESYMSIEQDKNIILRIDEYFDPTNSTSMCWIMKQPLTRYIFLLPNSKAAINIQRIQFMEYYRLDKIRVIIIKLNRKKYLIKIPDLQTQIQNSQITVVLELATDIAIRQLDQYKQQKGSIIYKSLELYKDKGYVKNDQQNIV